MVMYYQIIRNTGLLVLNLSGKWSIDKYKEYAKKVIKNPDFQYVTKVLSDFRKLDMSAESGGELDDLDELIKLRRSLIKKEYMNVYIIDDPGSTVIVHLYVDKLAANGYPCYYCSTLNKALELLKIEDTEPEMEQLIKDMIRSV